MTSLTWAHYISVKSNCISAFPPWFQGCLLACVVFFPWSKRYPDCPPTWLSWEQVSHDLKWDKLWMREDWLSGGRQSPSQFIWHGCLGNKAVRQEAEKRCKLLFVWVTAKKLPGLQASRGYAISLEILSIQWNIYLCLSIYLSTSLSISLSVCQLVYQSIY